MKPLYYLRLLALTALLIPALSHSARTLDRTLAKVNEEIVTESDMVREISNRLNQTYLTPEQAWKYATPEVAQSLVDRSLLTQAARRENITVPDTELNDEVEAMVRELRSKFRNETEFRATLAEEQLSVEELKSQILKKVRDDYRIHILVNRRYETQSRSAAANSTSGSVRLYRLAANVKKHGGPEQACRHARALALQAIASGLSFEEGIRQYSELPEAKTDGGDMGWLDLSQLNSEIRRAVQDLEVGHATAPMILGDTASIFYVAGKKSGRGQALQVKFEQARAALLADLSRKMTLRIYDERFGALLQKSQLYPTQKSAHGEQVPSQ